MLKNIMTSSKSKIAKIDALLNEQTKPDSPGAAVILIKNNRIVYEKVYGLANLEDRVPITPKTNFRLASFSKQFTAMAIMILVERKLLSLDASLPDFFPEFPQYGKRITIRHLLNHTSGLLDYENLIPKGTKIPLLDRDVLWLMEQQHKTYFPPGTKFKYSNTGYAILAVIIETVSGNTFPTFLKKNIFDPLQMVGTRMNERGVADIPNRAFGYSAKSIGFTRTDQSLTSYVLGDGGIYSSVADLYYWDQALYTTKLVSREMLKQAFTAGPATKDDKHPGYGFGWFIEQYRGKRCIRHSGGTIGFTTEIKRFPDQKFTVIMLANLSRKDAPGPASVISLTQKIVDLYLFDGK
jgi:CubicO group peptidase (beta-lactamase class C family)